MGKLVDLTGQRFGRLVVIERAGSSDRGHAQWVCLCDCGKTKIVLSSNLRTGKQISCGCFRNEKSLKRIIGYNLKHPSKRDKRLYKIWQGMRSRCYQKSHVSYPTYGGRGIKICDAWQQYENFERWALSAGYTSILTLDRINVNGDYTPENCRWATMKLQAYNRRDNHRLSFRGEYLTITEWAEQLGCTPTCLYYRLDAGWPIEEVLTIAPRTVRHRK